MSNDNAGLTASGGAPSGGSNQGMERSGQRPWSAGRIVALVIGILLLLGSLGIGAAAGAVAVADKGLRDGQGFFMSDQQALSSSGHAVASRQVELHMEGTGEFMPERFIGDVKVSVTPLGDAPVFVGIASAADAAGYLAGVRHSVLLDIPSTNGQRGDPVYQQEAGGPPTLAPGQTDIWAARASGSGEQSLVWPAEPGDWTVVVMNADGTSPVFASVAAGATFPALGWVVGIMLVVAGLMFVPAIVLIVLALRTRPWSSTASGTPAAATS